ncbi:alpha/beta fold hydrolase [Agromyces ramosus]|uniref:Alpha-beta hydrolase superfamily lysophospholipase n=1 Tax=Agromyces ramosus TaxID=33879 RepID=A0ABU0R8J9_9MICO|nr:alpha/beta fold hydrolase [Agromyces ramosus]MDQ0894385.1 alpha-beta hydrolase superfamily lysophospholipase [Agromyces ramosus]
MPTYTDAHGVRIHYESWRVADATAVVQLVHGVGEHIGRYRELIEALNSAGYSVWADDHRGHGQTGFEQHGGDLTRIGRLGPGGLRATIESVHQFTGVIRATEGELPLVLLGHSWGSFMAQIIVNQHAGDYDGVVLSGTAYRTLLDMDAGDLNRRHRHLGSTPVEWLSRDPDVAAAFMADPYTTETPLRKLFGTIDALRLLGRPVRGLPPELPLLIMVGSDDTVGGEQSAVKLANAYARRSGLVDVELIVYEGARHEIFNETNRDEVRADLVRWLDERFAVD